MGNKLQIGSRVLMGSSVRCCFHHTAAVLNNIEVIRTIASEKSAEFNKKLRECPSEAIVSTRSFNNAISIVGSRGSGKTSVILTLQRILHNDSAFSDDCDLYVEEAKDKPSNRNIIMPILMPQDCSPEQSLLSWVVSQLIEKAREIETQVDENALWYRNPWSAWSKESNRYYNESPLRRCIDDLIKAYELKHNGGHADSCGLSEEVFYYMDAVKRDSTLIANMLKLISMIVDYYRTIPFDRGSKRQQNDTGTDEPLIIFTIDDLDLAPQRSHEVIELVQRFLQHPNVVVICGWNQELFQNHLCIDLLRMQGVLTADQVNESFTFDDVFLKRYRKHTTALDSARRLAMDNLKKTFPTSQRYEIRSLSNTERANFPLGPKELEKHVDERLPTLFELVDKTIVKCRWHDEAMAKSQITKFLYENGVKAKPLNVYMRIFDNKARGITNVYRAFEAFGESLESSESDITYPVTILFDAILSSNTKFAPYRRGIRDLVQIRKVKTATVSSKGCLEYNCNYFGVNDLLNTHSIEKANKAYMSEKETNSFERKYEYFPKVIIDVYLLLNFMENMLRYVTGQTPSEHGGLLFSRALNEIYPPIKFENKESLEKAIGLNRITKLNFFPDTDVFRDNICLLNAYEKEGLEDRGYVFTGYTTLESIFKILDEKCKHNKSAFKQFNESNSEWVSCVVSVCESLQPTPQNIFRLAEYESLLKQNVDQTVVESFILENQHNYLDYIFSELSRYRLNIEPTSNDELDRMINCIRMLAANKKRFDDYLLRKDEKRKLREEEDAQATQRAELMCELARHLSESFANDRNSKFYITDFWEFDRTFKPLYRFKLTKPENYLDTNKNADFSKILEDNQKQAEQEYNTVKTATEHVERFLMALLNDLELKLLNNLACVAEKYRNEEFALYKMLLRISPAVGEYYRLWNLVKGAWSNTEIMAAAKLEIYFGITENSAPRELLSRIKRLGPSIKETQRNTYLETVNRLKQWFESRSSQFTDVDRKEIRKCIETLLRAPEHMVRNTGYEVELQNVLEKVGECISCECGRVAFRLYNNSQETIKKKGNSDQTLNAIEICNTIWPVSVAHLQSLDKYSSEILKIRKPMDTLTVDNFFELFDLNLYIKND